MCFIGASPLAAIGSKGIRTSRFHHMSTSEAARQRVREICLALPDTEEKTSHGESAWFHIKGKQFATFWDRHHDGPLAFLCAAPPGLQESLVAAHPDRFYRPPYYGPRGWIGVHLEPEADVDWQGAADLLAQAHAVTQKVARRR